ncbi:MAG: hypothetical protein A2033_17140 [Bacteroidetes bacterium GWA2_31_9]|nr:MAG: hypothetical protein A2033_17140 [Bacteroidetes bacterium GWA2_31_9]
MNNLYTFLLLFAAIFSCFNNVSAQTSVAGGNVSGTWTLADSPYLINGSIQIPNGQTLTIEPGVTVDFQGHYKLYVQGQILAIGTETDSITFTAVDTSTGWKGIRFDNTPLTNDSSRLNYCIIKNGKASGTGDENYGGGIYFNYYSKTVISYCLFIDNSALNYASWAGGIYCNYSNPVIINNTFSNNKSSSYGGAISILNSSPIISNNIFLNNSTTYGGGVFSTIYSSPIISNNTFSNNLAIHGGAIYCWGGSIPIIVNNIITNNSATLDGGGIHIYSSYPIIDNNSFIQNSASNSGGGIYGSNGERGINNNFFINNSAVNNGGGIYSCGGSISNNIISNNFSNYGGGIYLCDSTTIINTTIANNNSTKGGGIYFYVSNSIVKNCIIWNNTVDSSGSQVFLNSEDSDPDFFYCNVQGGTNDFGLNGDIFYTGTYQNNLDTNPLFVAPTAGSGTSYDGTTADWSLQAGSPCINAGTTDTTGLNLPSTDIVGNPRIRDGRIDIGAYESLPTSINYLITDNSINIYPNPNNGKFLLYLENFESKNYELQIFDITGQIIYSKNYENTVVLAENIDISEFGSGVYLVKISDGNKVFHKNIVIYK